MTGSGHSLLIFALMALVASLFCYLPGLLKNGGFPKKAARWLYVLFSLLVWTAAVWLFILFVRHRFQYTYVAGFSSRELPLGYLLSAVWAGQEGSFLIWVAFAAVLGLSFFRRTARLEAPGMVVFELSLVFLMALLIKQSPFRLSPEIPADGNGLNPLLQDFWMSIHPPLIFLGYAAYAIPFSLAMASCWTGDRKEWLSPALVWANVGFLTLGAGIIVGGFWAYKVLGWGGYWGWDPVENASLLPWLTGTALIHGLVMQRVQDRFSRGNIMLASVSFLLVLYGTFLTRSGVLANFSVHSFTDLGITGWLVWYILFFVFLSLGMLGWRWRRFRVEGKPVPFWSREMSFFLMILVLLMSTVLVGLGTSAPLLTGFTENPSSDPITDRSASGAAGGHWPLARLGRKGRLAFHNHSPGHLAAIRPCRFHFSAAFDPLSRTMESAAPVDGVQRSFGGSVGRLAQQEGWDLALCRAFVSCRSGVDAGRNRSLRSNGCILQNGTSAGATHIRGGWDVYLFPN
jgi:cytochrome c-type biogenesis protein CcmF